MPFLIRDMGSTTAQVYSLKPGPNTIGREGDNDIVILDTQKSLSRRHAVIEVSGQSCLVQDLRSSNYTYVNGKQIEQAQLQPGDIIHFGNVACRFVTTLPETKQADLPFSIVRQVSPTSVAIGDLLTAQEPANTVLRLRQRPQPDQRTADKLQILLEVSKQLSVLAPLESLLERILELLFEIMAVNRAVLLLVDPETGKLEPKATRTNSAYSPATQLHSNQIASFVVQQGEAILANNALTDQRFESSDSIIQQTIYASMCAPLKVGETVIGALYVDNQAKTNVYTDEDLDFLVALANQAAIAINNAQLLEKIQTEVVKRTRLERFFPKAVSQRIKGEEDLAIAETEVTALFSDITDFTRVANGMEPRQVLELLNEYFAVMVEDIVFRYEGMLEKYIADALLAVWGSPYQRPDDVQRAVQAAIEMQWAMQRLNQVWAEKRQQQWQIHIGLNTGRVAAGLIGSRQLIQYTHIGDAMNVASRICSQARAGEILISQATLDRLPDPTIPIAPVPTLTSLRGKDEPFQLYRVLWEQLPPKT